MMSVAAPSPRARDESLHGYPGSTRRSRTRPVRRAGARSSRVVRHERACDVILEGEGIRPVHGRIRWKSKRYKVEASPDAEFVLINGHKMTTGSIRQGDEIAVGECRMFLLRAMTT